MIGKILGKYHIVDRLGRGGMAEVYKAYQANLERYVAVKVIRTDSAQNPEYLTRFEREAKSVAALRHGNIVQVYDYDVDAETGQPYMVMEFIEGGSLAEHMEKRLTGEARFTLAETARIIGEVGAALAYAHQRGVVHRDVKPPNVMRENTGRMILTDFGLAKIAAELSLTASGMNAGTPAYMAPEQAMGQGVDARADLYALGVILYQLLTGRLPYMADTPMAVMLKHIQDPVPDPTGSNPDLPIGLARMVVKSMAKSPDERFQTADEFLTELQTALVEADPAFPVRVLLQTAKTPSLPTQPAPNAATKPAAPAPTLRGPYAITVEIKPPPEPSLTPQTPDFVGREKEMEFFVNELTTKHLAVISGMPGVGKTALASELTRRLNKPAQTFWHSFHASEGVNVLIWKLAGFLAWHEQRDLWHTLQSATQTGSQPPPPEVLFDYLFQMVRGQGYILCFDDFHFVDDDPLLGQFTTRLGSSLEAGEVDVVLTTQRRPEFVSEGDLKPLGGLSLADLRVLVGRRGMNVTDQLIADVHAHTDGNAELVMLALDALRRSKDTSRLIARLSESERVERFLVKEVDEGLSAEERQVMSGVAVLLGQAGTRDAIAAVLDGASVRRPLNDLVSRSLVTVIEGESGREYSLNALVRSFYYDSLSQRERQEMHRRAGAYYETEEPDALRAAIHFQCCGEQARAIQLIIADVWAILNQGRARLLRQLLEKFSEKQLDKPTWAVVLLARGQVYALLGETPLTRESYEAALAQVKALPEARLLEARAYLGLGELMQYDAPQEALAFFRRGLEGVQGLNSLEEAALNIRIGSQMADEGDLETAVKTLQQGLELLPPGPSRLHISALGNLGNIYTTQGDIERGLDYYYQVVKTAEAIDDYWAMISVWIALGIELRIAGRWAEALAHLGQAVMQAERLGSLKQQAQALLALGSIYRRQGDLALAQSSLSKCLAIARSRDWRDSIIYAGNSLAGVHLDLSEIESAEARLIEAEQLAQATGVRWQLPETYRYWALVRLAQDRPAEALAYAEQSVSLAREFQSYNDEGTGLRVLGQAQIAKGQREAALSSFEKSFALLDKRDPYEAACIQVDWGKALKSGGEADAERGIGLLQQARIVFQTLGARRDLAGMEALLN